MRSLKHFCSLLAVAVIASVTVGQPTQAADEAANLIKYRQTTMKAIGAHMGAMAAVAKGEVSFTDEVAGHAHAINALSKNLLRLFPKDSGKEAGETRALPAIWEKWSDFEAAVQKLSDESAKMAQVAEGGDVAAIGQQLGAVGKNGCGGCHETFRAKQD